MKHVIIDGLTIEKMSDVHEKLAKELAFPEDYGANLDALFDELTDISDDVTITLREHDALRKKLGIRYATFLKLLRRADSENPHLHLVDDTSKHLSV